MRVQLQATRYAMSKSLEMSTIEKPGRNNASAMVIEDRLSGDFANKFGSRDRVPLVASGSATFSNQLFYPVEKDDFGDRGVLPYYDVWVNGQRLSFLTADFVTYTFPADGAGFAKCGTRHTEDSRCWLPECKDGAGCVILQKIIQNYPGSGFRADGNFDINFDLSDPVPAELKRAVGSGHMGFMWQWEDVAATDELSTDVPIDVDGDFQEEQILSSTVYADGRTSSVNVIDRQAGDLDFTIDDRRKGVQVGLLPDSQMFSVTKSGTFYEVKDGKLFESRSGRYIRNMNINDHVDIVQRIFQLSNDTGRFCNGNIPRTPDTGWDGQPEENPVAACGNCFSPANVQLTCFDRDVLKIFIRSRIINRSGRSWLTRTEEVP